LSFPFNFFANLSQILQHLSGFQEVKIRFDASIVFRMTHLRVFVRKIMFRDFQLVRISYQKLDFHGISSFSDVFIINNLNAWRYKSGTMYTKNLFRLSFIRSDKKTPTLALVSSETEQTNANVRVFFVDSWLYPWFLICTSKH
jgi:hypothetical protein